jgi:uncharacterized protein YndB with AHSA1/START domain
MATTQIDVDGRPALRVERRLAHPPERVWRAISEPSELERWFVAAVEWTPAEGEEIEAAGDRVRVTRVEPPRELAWEWAAERYRFELSPDGDGTLLVFTHVFTPEFGPAWQHAAGWDVYFGRLEVHLDGGYISEEAAHARAPVDRGDHYRDAFAS